MDTILRYQTSLKRDFYRAIQMLRSLQGGNTRGNASPDPKGARGIINGRGLHQEDEGARISLI